MDERWASFDCYGTLIDWDGGIAAVIGAEKLEEYHRVEAEVQAEEPTLAYREVLRLAGDRVGADGRALADSLPAWAPFPEVRDALAELRDRGWRIAILSNTDPDYLEASLAQIAVPVDLRVVASEIGSYKPGHRHWEVFAERSAANPDRHVHVAASLFHDIRPATELGLVNVWINRLAEQADPVLTDTVPTRELTDLAGLPDTLDELVP
jgi:2-haloacid dehalogenase